MIKKAIDAFREREGYAGMAIYREGRLLFYDGLEPGLAGAMRRLFDDCGASFSATRVTAVIRGYTIVMFAHEGLLFICRFEGRFTPLPRPGVEEYEYATGQEATRIITREEARTEAEMMLKRLRTMADF